MAACIKDDLLEMRGEIVILKLKGLVLGTPSQASHLSQHLPLVTFSSVQPIKVSLAFSQ